MKIRPILKAAAAALIATTALSSAPSADATYPGGVGRLAFGLTVGRNTDVYSARPDGTGLRRLTDAPGFDACAAYDATGESVAFCSDRTGTLQVWTMRADGSEQRQVTSGAGRAGFPDYSPNGKLIAFSLSDASTALGDIWSVRLKTGALRQLTDTPSEHDNYPAYSPDGRSIVFLRANAARTSSQLWIMRRNGRHERQLTFDATYKDQLPDWRPDGRKIAYQAAGDIWLIDPDGSNAVNVTNTPGMNEYGVAWSPDGKRIAFLDFGQRVLYTMRADGTDVRGVGTGWGVQFVPGWQPKSWR